MLPSDRLTRRPWVTISACQSSAAPVPEVPVELAGGDTWEAPILAWRSLSLGRGARSLLCGPRRNPRGRPAHRSRGQPGYLGAVKAPAADNLCRDRMDRWCDKVSAMLGIPLGSIGPSRGRCLDKVRRDPAIAALINTRAASTVNSRPGKQRRSDDDQPMAALIDGQP